MKAIHLNPNLISYSFMLCAFFSFSDKLYGQSLTPSVIHAAGGGGQVGSSGVEIYYSIGEPLITTMDNGFSILTQGFLQSDVSGHVGLSLSPLLSPESCLDRKDGKLAITVNTLPPNTVNTKFYWTPSTVCPTGNCQSVENLAPGNYTVQTIAYDNSGIALDSVYYEFVIDPSTSVCQVIIYTGITPNGDGKNDFFYIENIESFTNNHVEIYNRWGQKLADIDHYNNQTNHWKGTVASSNEIAPSGTYFYSIDLGDGSKSLKGWIELTNHP